MNNDIFRTSFNYTEQKISVNSKLNLPQELLKRLQLSKETKPKINGNDICPYCKNQNTTKIIDRAELSDFETFYEGISFKALECHCCDAKNKVSLAVRYLPCCGIDRDLNASINILNWGYDLNTAGTAGSACGCEQIDNSEMDN